jgi:hypothetical protein
MCRETPRSECRLYGTCPFRWMGEVAIDETRPMTDRLREIKSVMVRTNTEESKS